MKHTTPSKIIWIDLEMTGLDATKDRIVEVAAIVTDWDFKPLGQYVSGVRQDEALLRERFNANPFARNRPAETQQLLELSLQGTPETQVQEVLRALIDSHCDANEVMLLGGNSVHLDRSFIKQWWPKVDERLHYRLLDVSAWKVVMQGKYGVEFKKAETHRALGDIRESIAELQSYLKAARFESK